MEDLYTEGEAAFSGVDRLYKIAKKNDGKISRKKVAEFLKSKSTYTKHFPARRKFQRNRIEVRDIDDMWSADLADMSSLSRHNSGFKWLLICVDAVSKFAFVEPLKRKTGYDTTQAFQKIFERSLDRKPKLLLTDKGTEFVNKELAAFFKTMNVKQGQTQDSATKSAQAEAMVKTLKRLIFRYLTETGQKRYIDKLQNLVEIYNNRIHRSIKMRPSQVNKTNVEEVRRNLYPRRLIQFPIPTKFKAGDKVRISYQQTAMTKAFRPTFSDEIYVIHKVLQRVPPVYKIKDIETGNKILGTFYKEELVGIK